MKLQSVSFYERYFLFTMGISVHEHKPHRVINYYSTITSAGRWALSYFFFPVTTCVINAISVTNVQMSRHMIQYFCILNLIHYDISVSMLWYLYQFIAYHSSYSNNILSFLTRNGIRIFEKDVSGNMIIFRLCELIYYDNQRWHYSTYKFDRYQLNWPL